MFRGEKGDGSASSFIISQYILSNINKNLLIFNTIYASIKPQIQKEWRDYEKRNRDYFHQIFAGFYVFCRNRCDTAASRSGAFGAGDGALGLSRL